MKKESGGLKMVLAVIGAFVVLGGAVVAIIHFWEDIKKKLPCCKDECEDFEELLEDELDELEEEVVDEMEDFVEFEEI